MAPHEPIPCPRCGQPFECKPGNITECQCFGLSFTDAEKSYIEGIADNCLCRNCLLELQRELRYENTRNSLVQMQALIARTKG